MLRKGQQIAIRGKLRLEEWTDRATQQPRKSHKVIADQIAIVNPVRFEPDKPESHLSSVFGLLFGHRGAFGLNPMGL